MTDLTGKGKPFHSALDRALASLPEKASPEQVVNHLLKMGVKPQELIDRRLDKEIGAELIPRERTVKLKKPDNKGRTEIVEPYFETTSVKGAKAIPRSAVEELAAKNPMYSPQEKVLGGGAPNKDLLKRIALEAAQEDAFEELRDEGMRASLAEDIARDLAQERLPQYLEAARNRYGESAAVYHQDYTIPGGENYREMLIKAPQGGEEFGGVSAHFGGEKNILASMRLKDRIVPDLEGPHSVKVIGGGGTTTVKHPTREAAERFADVKHQGGYRTEITPMNQKKLLHLEELQSDWHQKGREGGYGSRLTPEDEAKIADFEARQRHQANPVGEPLTLADRADWASLIKKREGAVPDAPFKKNWEEMALKRLVHHAAEKGYHGIVVTPGAEQADRYNLAKQVEHVTAAQEDGKFRIFARDLNGKNHDIGTYEANQLSGVVGKDLATKIAAQEKPTDVYEGVDLQVGGEGMKGFYDKKVPNILNGIGKKHGVKTELHGHTLQGRGRERTEEEFQQATRNVPFERHKEFDYEPKPIPVHYFPITEDMRKDVLTNGLPLYKQGGIIRKAEGGNVQIPIEQMRQQLMAAGRPLQDLSQIGANEAPNMPTKAFVIPHNGAAGSLPMGGVDMSPQQPGQQFLPASMLQPQPNPLLPQQPPASGAPAPEGGSNILQMTPQGQAMAAMKPPAPPMQKAVGGSVPMPVNNHPFRAAGQKPMPFMAKMGGSSNMPMNNNYSDNGATDFSIDNIQQLAMGGQVQGYASKGYVMHTPSKPHPVVGTRFKAVPQGNLVKEKPFNFEDYENKGSIINSPYDATTRDNLVSEISGHNLVKPLLTEAGFRYSLDKNHYKQNIGGASNLGIAGRQQGRVDQAFQEHGGDVFMMPSTMSDSDKVKDYPENFSHHPTHILLDLMKQRQFNKNILKAISDDLRNQHELVENKKTGKKVKVFPYKNFIGFDHPMAEDQLMNGGYGLDTTAGNLRKKMVERLGSVGMQKMLDYNIGDLRSAILDPDLATDPKGFMGAVVVKGKPNAALRQSSSSSYDTDLYGKYKGGFKNRPIEIVQPDVFSTIDKELRALPKNKGKSEASIRAQVIGAIEKRKERIAQPINSRVVNNAGLYEEGLKQGEFDPKNLESILGYYKRKGGYKKGGGVKKAKLSDNLDTMRLALTRNKKAK